MFKHLALVLALASLCACQGTRSAPRPESTGPFVVPAGAGAWWTFEDARYGRVEDPAGELTGAVPAGAGRARAASSDLVTGWAAVVYEGQLAAVQLASGEVEWHALATAGTSPRAAVREGWVTVCSESVVTLVNAVTGELAWSHELGGWLDTFGLDRIDFALPLSADELVLVASAPGGGFEYGKILVQRIDTASGDWRVLVQNELAGLTWVDGATSDGKRLYLTGVFERLQLGAGQSRGRLFQNFVVLELDPESLQSREIVWEERFQRDSRVVDVAAGRGLVAVLLAPGELRIYRVHESGRTSTPLYQRRFPSASSVAWVDDRTVVVHTPAGVLEVEVD